MNATRHEALASTLRTVEEGHDMDAAMRAVEAHGVAVWVSGG